MAFRYGQKYDIEIQHSKLKLFILKSKTSYSNMKFGRLKSKTLHLKLKSGQMKSIFSLFEVERFEFDFEPKSALPSRKEAEML